MKRLIAEKGARAEISQILSAIAFKYEQLSTTPLDVIPPERDRCIGLARQHQRQLKSLSKRRKKLSQAEQRRLLAYLKEHSEQLDLRLLALKPQLKAKGDSIQEVVREAAQPEFLQDPRFELIEAKIGDIIDRLGVYHQEFGEQLRNLDAQISRADRRDGNHTSEAVSRLEHLYECLEREAERHCARSRVWERRQTSWLFLSIFTFFATMGIGLAVMSAGLTATPLALLTLPFGAASLPFSYTLWSRKEYRMEEERELACRDEVLDIRKATALFPLYREQHADNRT